MANLLVVDDEPSICWGLSRLGGELGHTVRTASSAEEGLELARSHVPDAVILDVRLPGMDGLTALSAFGEMAEAPPVIIITAYGDLQTAVDAVRKGAFEYLVKPFELDVAQRAIERALDKPSAPQPAPAAAPPIAEIPQQIVGSSPPSQEVFKRIALVADSDACVHIHGESGTGKELIARAIHRYSRRSTGPFVAVNAASLSPSLAESELFGHVRGAFTGAEQARQGLLEHADGGTLFLDEVADIPLPVQVKLLRALEYGEILPVGSNQPVRSDFRVISATHQNLHQCVLEGTFREDLYYRLVTFEIHVPALRDRPQDISELAEHFLDLFSARTATARPHLTDETRTALESRPWHGNVRELRNALEHAIVVARGGQILPEHLPPPIRRNEPGVQDCAETLSALIRNWTTAELDSTPQVDDLYTRLLKIVEPPLLKTALARNSGQFLATARQLGLHRVTLKKKLDQFANDE
ncbi:MAG: sigma-54-dependent Fis family transcriptional regulator [Pirellulales bacterium]|nr:sigma-54-dependent Fis family transcriptional regulator [Pirellulales bacterium]